METWLVFVYFQFKSSNFTHSLFILYYTAVPTIQETKDLTPVFYWYTFQTHGERNISETHFLLTSSVSYNLIYTQWLLVVIWYQTANI